MLSAEEQQTVEWFKQLAAQAVARGAISRFCSHGVVVLCLPRYGEAEQLLLETLPSSKDRAEGRRGGNGPGQSPDLGTGAGGGAGALGELAQAAPAA